MATTVLPMETISVVLIVIRATHRLDSKRTKVGPCGELWLVLDDHVVPSKGLLNKVDGRHAPCAITTIERVHKNTDKPQVVVLWNPVDARCVKGEAVVLRAIAQQ